MAEQDIGFTLDQIQVVLAIAHHGSFRKAADHLYLSQPAVSLQIQNLERQLGVTLFNRKGRRVHLTEPGEIFITYAEQILNLCDEATGVLADLQGLKKGSLKLGASQTVGTYIMPQLIGQFSRKYPYISVRLMVQSTRRTTAKLVDGDLDLAIVGGEIPPELHPHLKILPYAQDEFILVTSGTYPEGIWLNQPPPATRSLKKSDLKRLQFIMLDSNSTTRQTLDQALGESGIDPSMLSVQIELSSIEAIKAAVRVGLGVAFLSQIAVGLDLEQEVLKRLHVSHLQVKRSLWLVYNPDHYQSRAAQVFREGLLQQSDWLVQRLPFLDPSPAPQVS